MARRLSFLTGLLLGSGLCAWFLGAALIYLFTGKLLSLQTGHEGIQLKLQDPTYYEVVPREEG
ncbi:MAG TPA: hypothetical protein VM366_06255 [Anaerolineae bacterium]|jgi:hypothetical protein|nr:hypothetical protein [Anaerolineae bacterium]